MARYRLSPRLPIASKLTQALHHDPAPTASRSGYRDPAYAASLAEFGEPRLLEGSQGSLLLREISGASDLDAIGPYPVFSCLDWSKLPFDLEELRDRLVSISLVPAPFDDYTPSLLQRCFPDRCEPYKEHFVVDLPRGPLQSVTAHHRRKAARASRQVDVERVQDPGSVLEVWQSLYGELTRRHRISGLRAFSTSAFAQQLRLPGLVAIRATHGGRTVSMSLWLLQGEVAYYHLGASSRQGYDVEAAYAMFAFALEQFAADGLGWASLGAGAGVVPDPSDGLTRFKAGWASCTRTAYFCGRVLSPGRYVELSRRRVGGGRAHFPAYRQEASL